MTGGDPAPGEKKTLNSYGILDKIQNVGCTGLYAFSYIISYQAHISNESMAPKLLFLKKYRDVREAVCPPKGGESSKYQEPPKGQAISLKPERRHH